MNIVNSNINKILKNKTIHPRTPLSVCLYPLKVLMVTDYKH